ncbi:hypothetical protein V1477_017803 [Vespula maculifrons]|uniref:Uncharacterized protein n=1 Tax=Vespula maculifrons TaxID=7453 RepID=A0ABD2B0H6_VESMC
MDIWTKKIWACRTRRAPSNELDPVPIGAIVSAKKIFPLNRYNSFPIGQIRTKKVWACRTRRASSKEPGPVPLLAIVSERQIVKEKFCSYWSDLDEKNMGVLDATSPFQRTRSSSSPCYRVGERNC